MLFNVILLSIYSIFTSYQEPVPLGKFNNLGAQVSKAAISTGTFLSYSNKNMFYTVVKGNPAYLLGYDLKDNSLAVNLPLKTTGGSWGMVKSSDGSLYISGAEGGRVYKHYPGSQIVEDLGVALKGEIYLWEMVAGRDGEVFGTTYPGCRVFRYHPKDGFSDVGRGALVEGQNYVRSIAYHEKSGKIYAGVGSKAYLIELDPKTGIKNQILPENYKGKTGFVYPLVLVPGLSSGDKLFATVLGKTLVYDVTTNSIEREITKGINSLAISKNPELKDNKVYYTFSNKNLQVMNLLKPEEPPVIIGNTDKALAMSWINNSLYLINAKNDLVIYDPVKNIFKVEQMNFPQQPILIRMTGKGTDGKIWTSGYPVGNNAAYDPRTGKTQAYDGLHQSESIVNHNKNIYFGVYPKANIYLYDSTKPWNLKEANPKLIAAIKGQDRPFGAVAVPDQNSMFFGTVPEYGALGGILGEYNEKTEKFINHGVIIKDLSIVSLAYKDNLVFGGTSIFGGLGVKPALASAKLFAWNIKESRKIFECEPIAGAKQITSVIIGPDGHLWGVADDTLFVFDTNLMKVISTHKLVDKFISKSWININLVLHPSGFVYGAGSDAFFRIDPRTMAVTSLNKKASWLSMDNKGKLYFSIGNNLWQYVP
jgi:hypothetical protein